ncbi:MAG: class II fructose-1,6-bisphosphate aldolase [Dethiobacter sp.]|jgi:fructose-bisphosphate aldolase class II|nr:class II fructose-1,6-bisphosphate aldolase [Dethiobacter sp.]MBS3899287.1 class II fructose-1,6-bisphosphate aldolase [Dethiobacter sp.]MBS3982755.1 class II fructose-1,6-bisphosphate aldolase [Dethiobacter sp.]MCL4462710.1 class II fructose-1,6-bisphosphate aldolase [Bacillota bacterium]MCL5994402.1 class II fructose-1,6-bisphosphate aldolase [Bacillota bacterium]
MPFATLQKVLAAAERGGYAVGAFNTNNMEIIQAIVEAAEEEKSPVILQASQGALKYAGIQYIAAMVRAAVETSSVPVVLHLDHGTSFAQTMLCLKHGFTSVMFDGSKYSLAENIAATRKVVDVAHAMGASVEGELGKIGGTEDDISVDEHDALFTDPAEAERFVNESMVDALAVAIGTAHGPYKGEPQLDFARLESINRRVEVPIVLHGASGVSAESIRRAIALGVCKINIDTELRQAFARSVQQVAQNKPGEYDPRKILGPAKEEMKKIVREKMRLFGCSGKAGE